MTAFIGKSLHAKERKPQGRFVDICQEWSHAEEWTLFQSFYNWCESHSQLINVCVFISSSSSISSMGRNSNIFNVSICFQWMFSLKSSPVLFLKVKYFSQCGLNTLEEYSDSCKTSCGPFMNISDNNTGLIKT